MGLMIKILRGIFSPKVLLSLAGILIIIFALFYGNNLIKSNSSLTEQLHDARKENISLVTTIMAQQKSFNDQISTMSLTIDDYDRRNKEAVFQNNQLKDSIDGFKNKDVQKSLDTPIDRDSLDRLLNYPTNSRRLP